MTSSVRTSASWAPLVLAAWALAGCRHAAPAFALSPEPGVVTLGDASPPSTATSLGEVVGQSGSGCGILGTKGSQEGAEAAVRERTAALGGNYAKVVDVVPPLKSMDCLSDKWVVHAVAYRTADAPVAASPTASAPAPPCDPPCSPGYACGAGICLALCNPLCGPGQVCRQDRVCVPATN